MTFSVIDRTLKSSPTPCTHLSVDGAALLHDGVEAWRLAGVLASGGARRSGRSGLVIVGRLWDRCRQRAGQFCSAVHWEQKRSWIWLHNMHVMLRSSLTKLLSLYKSDKEDAAQVAWNRLHSSSTNPPGIGGGGTSWIGSTGTLGARVSNSSWLMTFSFLKFSTSCWRTWDKRPAAKEFSCFLLRRHLRFKVQNPKTFQFVFKRLHFCNDQFN